MNYEPGRPAEITVYPGTFTPVNKAGIQNPGELRQIEEAATALRLNELRDRPVKPTFDFRHVQEIHRRLFQDVYAWAGRFSHLEIARWNTRDDGNKRSYAQRNQDMLGRAHEVALLKTLSREHVIQSMARGLVNFREWQPFPNGNIRTALIFTAQLMQVAGYEFDFTRIDRARWNQAHKEAGADGADSAPGAIALRGLIRESARPLRAIAFEEAWKLKDARHATEQHPELRAVFDALHDAHRTIEAAVGSSNEATIERRMAPIVQRMQRVLDTGAAPENVWAQQLDRVTRLGQSVDR